MNPGVEYYRGFGRPARNTLTVVSRPVNGDSVTVAGVVFEYGRDFTGQTTNEVAESLCAAINGDRGRVHLTSLGLGGSAPWPNLPFYGIYYRNIIQLTACDPGTVGNSFTLSSSSAAIVAAAANFGGGTDVTHSVSVVAAVPVTPTTATILYGVVTRVTPSTFGLGYAPSITFKQITFFARNAPRVDNGGEIWIQFTGLAPGGIGVQLQPGESYVFTAPEGLVFSSDSFFIDTTVGGDGASFIIIR